MKDVVKEIVKDYQELFDFFCIEHDLVLTVSEMDEIVYEAQKFVKKMNKNRKEI